MLMLPQQWQETTLGEVAVISRENVQAHSVEPDILYLGLEHVEPRTTRILGTGKAGQLKSAARAFRKGDVLYGALRPYLSKVCIPDFDGVCSPEFVVFTQSMAIHNRFLLHLLNSPVTSEFAANAVRGANLPRVRYAALATLPILLPPVAEQVRIAAKVDELLLSARTTRERISAAEGLIGTFRTAALASAFGVSPNGPAVEPVAPSGTKAAAEDVLPQIQDSWSWATAQGVVANDAEITYGIVQPGPNVATGVPYVSSQDIGDYDIRQDGLARTTPEIASAYARSELRTGDVLLGIIRHVKVATVPSTLAGANISRSVARLRPSERITSEFLAAWLRSPFARTWLQRRARGIDMPVINIRDVRALPIPLPPVEVQEEIVTRVDGLFETARSFSRRLSVALSAVDALERKVVQLALAGRLVPQSAEDKPAPIFWHDDIVPRRAKAPRKAHRKVGTMRGTQPRITIAEVLRQRGAMAPEAVLQACGYTVETIEEFFAELRHEALSGAVVEQRDGHSVTLVSAKDHA
jgi:type I restriction enzyme S subunit